MENKEVGSAQPSDAVSGGQGGDQQVAGSAEPVENQQQSSGPSPRMLGEIKSLKAKLEELSAANEQLQMQKLQADGDKDKTIEFLQGKVQTLEAKNKSREEKIALTTLGSQVKTEAAKMGCANPDDLLKLMDLKSIPVDPETYNGDADSIRLMLEEEKKSRPFFFTKAAPQVHDVNPQNTVINRPQVDFNKMTREELNEELRKIYNEQF